MLLILYSPCSSFISLHQVTLSTAECLGILQKASTPQSASSRDRRYKSLTTPSPPLVGNPEGPLSSEVSPMSTAEKRSARPLGHHNPSPQQFHPGKTQALGTSAPGSTNAMAGTGLHHQATNHAGSKPKRKRTQFTDEQRKKMQAYAEQAGWTVVGQRKETIAAACEDIGKPPTYSRIHSNLLLQISTECSNCLYIKKLLELKQRFRLCN